MMTNNLENNCKQQIFHVSRVRTSSHLRVLDLCGYVVVGLVLCLFTVVKFSGRLVTGGRFYLVIGVVMSYLIKREEKTRNTFTLVWIHEKTQTEVKRI